MRLALVLEPGWTEHSLFKDMEQPNREMRNLTDSGTAPLQVTATWNTSMLSQDAALSEAQLVRRVAQGDREAFGDLYDRYSKPLYSFAVRILNDRWEAEDVLQEVFLKIWEKAPSFDEAVGRPFSWAVTVTRNKAVDRLRARRRQLRVFGETADSAIVDETTGEAQPVEHVGRDQAVQIRAAVNGLPHDQRRPIELASFGGLTHLEIADSMKQPLGTIKARIRRGMLRLREGLEVRG